jgi:hypothetical protein
MRCEDLGLYVGRLTKTRRAKWRNRLKHWVNWFRFLFSRPIPPSDNLVRCKDLGTLIWSPPEREGTQRASGETGSKQGITSVVFATFLFGNHFTVTRY